MAIAKLEPVDLRDLWKHEESGFSAWLEENIGELAERLGMKISVIQKEKSAGAFQIDLLAEDGEGGYVIIENQLEQTDHDHLGKILTYLTTVDAKTAIWITKDPRPEHIKAVTWLNDMTPADVSFYLVKLSAYRIGKSDPAPHFEIKVAPSAVGKGTGKKKEELAERQILRLKFWEQLLTKAKEEGFLLHSGRSPSKQNWLSTGAGKAGLNFNYVVWIEDETGIELYIDIGEKEANKSIFEKLYSSKDKIERVFGDALTWERLDDARASRISYLIKKGGIKNTDKWPAMQKAMIDAMRRFSEALKPHIKVLNK